MRKELKAVKASKRIRGEARRLHFAQGGSLPSWRGRSWVNTDRRKESDRKACRGRQAHLNDKETH